MDPIKKEILNMSYYEHFKAAKELSQVLPLKHPKRLRLEKEMANILSVLNNE